MPLTLIPFLLLVVPIVEIAVFIAIGGKVGIGLTLALILFTAVLGTILLRVQGFAIVTKIRRELESDRLPGRDLGDGAMILVAGILLLTPGFVTDTIGFLLFVPAVRTLLWNLLASRLVAVNIGGEFRAGPHEGREDRVVDLDPEEFSEKENPDSPWHDRSRR